MKKLLFLILSLLVALSLASCDDEYEPVESTAEEARVVLTLSFEGERYNVRYELYRALFLNNKSAVDAGNSSVWSGDDAEIYINRINDIIITQASEIYGAIHLANKLGYNAFSADADRKVKEYVKISVEGDDASIMGHGTYEKYLASLKERNMNYAVADLMIRYGLALDAINEYYLGTSDDALGNLPGEITPTDSELESYYFGEDCVRLLRAFVQNGVKTKEEAEQLRDGIDACSSDVAKALYIIQNTAATAPELLDEDDEPSGILIGRYALDSMHYREYTEAAFALEVGEVSSVIEISSIGDGISDGYYILTCIEKTAEHFNENKALVLESYLDNLIGSALSDASSGLSDNAKTENGYYYVNHAEISMD